MNLEIRWFGRGIRADSWSRKTFLEQRDDDRGEDEGEREDEDDDDDEDKDSVDVSSDL